MVLCTFSRNRNRITHLAYSFAKIFSSDLAPFHVKQLRLILAASFIYRFCSCHMEFCKSALPAGETVLMFSHENAFTTPGTISFRSSKFVLSFCFEKFVYLDLSFFVITYFFIRHYLLPLAFSPLDFSGGCLFGL
jgi:hypothetical protein